MDYLPLGGRRRGFTPRTLVSSSITHRVLFVYLHRSSLYLYLIFTAVDMFIFGLDCLSILLLAYYHVPHINCLIYNLNWYFYILGSKRSRVFHTHIELSAYNDTFPINK